MNYKEALKNTGFFCIGASIWAAEKTAQATASAGKVMRQAAGKMADRGGAYYTLMGSAAQQSKNMVEAGGNNENALAHEAGNGI